MNADDIRFLSYYLIPKDWNIHLIDRKTDEKQLEVRKYFNKIFIINVFFFLFSKFNKLLKMLDYWHLILVKSSF